MSELTPEKLGEMTGGKAPESLFRRPERKVVTDTVTAVGSPLTDPGGVEKGRYSYSETTGGDQNDWWSQSWWTPERIADQQKRFTLLSTDPRHPMMTGEPIWRERTAEQWAQYVKEAKEARGLIQPEKKKGLFSRIRKSGDNMTDDIRDKGISQCMAERLAQGTQRGAFSKAYPVDIPSNGTPEGAIGAFRQQQLDKADVARALEKQTGITGDMRTRTTMNDIGVEKPRVMIYIKHPDGTMEDITEKVPPTMMDLAEIGKFEATTDYASREPDDEAIETEDDVEIDDEKSDHESE